MTVTSFYRIFDLPLLQPLVYTAVVETLPHMEKVATLISQYVTAEEKVAPLPMIQHLQNEIPFQYIEQMRQMNPKVWEPMLDVIYDTAARLPPQVSPGEVLIKSTAERQLITWLKAYHGRCSHFFGFQRYVNFFNQIPGMEIIEHATDRPKYETCDKFVFGDLDWYHTNFNTTPLFNTPDLVIRFLAAQGFSRTTQGRPGNVVVYHTEKKVEHFAKVEQVEDDKITVLSKFGENHVFRHSLESVPPEYGDRVTFLNFPPAVQK